MDRCAWCDSLFVKDHAQRIYCSVSCRTEASREATKAYAKRAKYRARVGKKRLCKECKRQLSVYNNGPVCSTCSVRVAMVKRALANMKEFTKHEESI